MHTEEVPFLSPLESLNKAFMLNFPSDAARQIARMSPAEAAATLQDQPVHIVVRVFERLSHGVADAILLQLSDNQASEVLSTMESGLSTTLLSRLSEKDRERLLNDAGIIRNRLKVDAAISNAQRIREMRDSHSGFANWLDAQHPLSREEWIKLFKKTFRFTGGEITPFLPDERRLSTRCARYGLPGLQDGRKAGSALDGEPLIRKRAGKIPARIMTVCVRD